MTHFDLPDFAPIADWDDAYSNSKYIPAGESYAGKWASLSAEFRARHPQKQTLPYGHTDRQSLDLFLPEGKPKGLLVFVHGGYWLAFDKSAFSFLAQGPLERGWAVALPSYPLAPEVRLSVIGRNVEQAIEMAARHVAGPIRLAGHSAGGHLVTRAISLGTTIPDRTLGRIEHVISISGLHDLRPLMRTTMNTSLLLNETEARQESPALLVPACNSEVTCWVGAEERPEFLRQNALLANIWTGLGVAIRQVVMPQRHHFNVIEDLVTASAQLTQCCAP